MTKTNKRLKKKLNFDEFTQYLGIWLLMSTLKGHQETKFWSSKPVSIFDGAPICFGHIEMSYRRFQDITQALQFTNKTPPSYKDPFFYVRQMLDAWNSNMGQIFVPGWLNCLDESMSSWSNRYTCPGWLFVPQKPHPFGNEYRTVCCGTCGILWNLKLVEGNSAPVLAPPKNFLEKRKTTLLLLHLTRHIHGWE